METMLLFLDESVDLDTAWLTGIFVPTSLYPEVRDGVVRIAREALVAAGHNTSTPVELHGVEMLKSIAGATDQIKLGVFSQAVALVNRHQLEVLSIGHVEAKAMRQNLRRILMDPGDKLHNQNLQEMVNVLALPHDVVVLPIFDGVPGRAPASTKLAPVDRFAYDAFLLGGSITQWNRVACEERPIPAISFKPNLRNLAEPVFADSARSPVLQLADIIGYLLGSAERALRQPSSDWKSNLAAVAHELDPYLVRRQSVRWIFQGP